MADGTTLNTMTGGDKIRDIDRGANGKTQVVQLDVGGASAESLVSSANPLPTTPGSTDYARLPAVSSSVLLSAAATTNATSVKGSAGAIKSIQGYNAKVAAVYLKLYNKATAPTVGTDTPVKTLYIPAASAYVFDFPAGFVFATGIAYALTGAAALADTTALASGDILCQNIDYI